MKLHATGRDLIITEAERLISGSINIYTCEFTFDSSWDGYMVTAVFSTANRLVNMAVVDGKCDIPVEVLRPNSRLRIGIFGNDGVRTKPTTYSEWIPVEQGADPSGRTGRPPDPTTYEQWMNALDKQHDEWEAQEKAREEAEAAREAAEKLRGVGSIYVGSGDCPDGFNIQIDPDGDYVLTPESIGAAEKEHTHDEYANALTGRVAGWSLVEVADASIAHKMRITFSGYGEHWLMLYKKNFYDYREGCISKVTVPGSDNTMYGMELYIPRKNTSTTFTISVPRSRNGVSGDYLWAKKHAGGGSKQTFKLVQAGVCAEPITFTMLPEDRITFYNPIGNATQAETEDLFSRYGIQIELGEQATAYEECYKQLIANSDTEKELEIVPFGDKMTFWTQDGDYQPSGALITVEYTRDTNKVIEQLTNAIISLGGNV